jgi:hypothetical protein
MNDMLGNDEDLEELIRKFLDQYPWDRFLHEIVGWICERYKSLSEELVGQRPANILHLDPYEEIPLENDVVPVQIELTARMSLVKRKK